MAIVFPINPSVNDTFTVGSITYKWDSTKWIGLGVTPTDRLIEGSNSLEIDANNNLVYSGGKVGVNQGTPTAFLHTKSGANDGTVISTFEGATNNKLDVKFISTGPAINVTAGDPLVFEMSGSEKMRLDGSGRLLINTDDSTTVWGYGDGSLQLMGDYQGASASFINNEANTNSHAITLAKTRNGSILQNGDTFGAIVFSGDDSNGYYAAARIIANVDGTPSDNVMPGRLSFQTGGTGGGSPIERLRINSDGNVSITTIPTTNASKLFIRANSGADAGRWSHSCLALYNTTLLGEYSQMGLGYTVGTWAPSYFGFVSTSQASYGNGALVFGTRGVTTDSQPFERFRIQPSGFVGIGEDSPGAQLTVKRASGSTSGLLGVLKLKQGSATNGNRASLLFSSLDDFDVAAVNGVIETHSGSASSNEGRLEFWTKHAGSDIAVRGKFDSEGSFYNFAENHGIYTHSSVGGGTIKYLYRAAHSNGSTIVFNVWSNGTTENTTGTIGTVSDESLKENIVDAGSQWADIKAVKFRKFNFKEETGYETHTQLGVIAQELEATSPGLIYEVTEDDGRVIKRVKSSILTNKALVALQEAMTRIETLEQRLSDAGL
jgi:hypothetical protein